VFHRNDLHSDRGNHSSVHESAHANVVSLGQRYPACLALFDDLCLRASHDGVRPSFRRLEGKAATVNAGGNASN
jgi:hypothetical protein